MAPSSAAFSFGSSTSTDGSNSPLAGPEHVHAHDSRLPHRTVSPRFVASLPPRSPTHHTPPTVHVDIPGSVFAAQSTLNPHSPAQEQLSAPNLSPNRHTYTTAIFSPRRSSSPARHSPDSQSPLSPPSPSKSDLRRLPMPALSSTFALFPEVHQAGQHLRSLRHSPHRRHMLCGAMSLTLQLLSLTCVIWFTVVWMRTYSFHAARKDLVTMLRCLFLFLCPLPLCCLPAVCALSAVLAWPRMITGTGGPHGHGHRSGANNGECSPVSFTISRARRSSDSSHDHSPSSDAYTVAAASEDVLHDTATPRFGLSVITEFPNDANGFPCAAELPTSPNGQSSPGHLSSCTTSPMQAFADAFMDGEHRMAEALPSRHSSDLQRPLHPLKPSPTASTMHLASEIYSHPRNIGATDGGGASDCCTQACCLRAVAAVLMWVRHELYLAVLCLLAGYGTLGIALFDRYALSRFAGGDIVTYTTPRLQSFARTGTVVMFCLYSMLLTCGCACGLLSLCLAPVFKRRRSMD